MNSYLYGVKKESNSVLPIPFNGIKSNLSNVTYYYSKAPIQKLKPIENINTQKQVRFENSNEYINNNNTLNNLINYTTDQKINLILDRLDNLELYINNINIKLDKLINKKEIKLDNTVELL
tara:strand:+ start:1398 stop:1760 length:363 start_codon:yes stop_codon:yes gene_type:complete